MNSIQDHGKSSLASRVLEYTGNLGHERQLNAYQVGSESDGNINNNENATTSSSTSADTTNDNSSTTTTTTTTANKKDAKEEITLLDTLTVERERGITVKASAASMLYYNPTISTNKDGYILLNMVDSKYYSEGI